MTKEEVVAALLRQTRCGQQLSVRLYGAAAFRFLFELGVLDIYEIVPGDPTTSVCNSTLRIPQVGCATETEFGWSIMPNQTIWDEASECKRQPEEVLSLEAAPEGWEPENLLPSALVIAAIQLWLGQPDAINLEGG